MAGLMTVLLWILFTGVQVWWGWTSGKATARYERTFMQWFTGCAVLSFVQFATTWYALTWYALTKGS